jgi:ribulose-5-phosphate 4-epimerase/fuculose-1-phosphate aldolase
MGSQEKEGVIKFSLVQESQNLTIHQSTLDTLNKVRSHCLKNEYIGVDENGLGYGNLSIRLSKSSFLITSSQTGHLPELGFDEVSEVTGWEFLQNRLNYKGKSQPSSESMTHAAIYQASEEINAIIHIHQELLWLKLQNGIPTTPATIAYGTPEMAFSVLEWTKKSISANNNQDNYAIAMAGHHGGLLFYGKSLESVFGSISAY